MLALASVVFIDPQRHRFESAASQRVEMRKARMLWRSDRDEREHDAAKYRGDRPYAEDSPKRHALAVGASIVLR